MIDGTYNILYLDIGQGFLPVGSLTANSFSETVETLDTTNIENGGWKTYVLTKQEYTINFSGVAINSLYAGGDNTKFSYDVIKIIKRNRTLIDWRVEDDAGNLDYGKCYITDLSSESNIDEFISFNATLLGYGVPNEPEEPEEPDNEAPTVIVTSDLYSMTLPINQTNLQATASDADGNIVSYQWTKVAGGNVSIVSPNSTTTDITGMVEDSYIFRCTVTDNDGLTAFDQKVINVLAQQEVLIAFNTSLGNNTGNCLAPQSTPLYFNQIPPATNTSPLVGDEVFSDINGTIPLNNTSTTMYYMSSLTAFGVNLGVVVSIAPCTTP